MSIKKAKRTRSRRNDIDDRALIEAYMRHDVDGDALCSRFGKFFAQSIHSNVTPTGTLAHDLWLTIGPELCAGHTRETIPRRLVGFVSRFGWPIQTNTEGENHDN